VGHAARMGRCKVRTKCCSEILRGTDHSENLGVGGRIILEWILGKQDGKGWTGCVCLRIGTSGGLCCEQGNEPLGSVQGRKFRD
jgi:hypothetical protein